MTKGQIISFDFLFDLKKQKKKNDFQIVAAILSLCTFTLP